MQYRDIRLLVRLFALPVGVLIYVIVTTQAWIFFLYLGGVAVVVALPFILWRREQTRRFAMLADDDEPNETYDLRPPDSYQ